MQYECKIHTCYCEQTDLLIFNTVKPLHERPPLIKDHPVNFRPHFKKPFLDELKTKKHLNKDHLSIKTMFCHSLGWPLFTGLTVLPFLCILFSYIVLFFFNCTAHVHKQRVIPALSTKFFFHSQVSKI